MGSRDYGQGLGFRGRGGGRDHLYDEMKRELTDELIWFAEVHRGTVGRVELFRLALALENLAMDLLDSPKGRRLTVEERCEIVDALTAAAPEIARRGLIRPRRYYSC